MDNPMKFLSSLGNINLDDYAMTQKPSMDLGSLSAGLNIPAAPSTDIGNLNGQYQPDLAGAMGGMQTGTNGFDYDSIIKALGAAGGQTGQQAPQSQPLPMLQSGGGGQPMQAGNYLQPTYQVNQQGNQQQIMQALMQSGLMGQL